MGGIRGLHGFLRALIPSMVRGDRVSPMHHQSNVFRRRFLSAAALAAALVAPLLGTAAPRSTYAFSFAVGGFGVGDGQFNLSPSVAIGPGGDFYVTDLLNHRIQQFDRGGAFIRVWGGPGTANGRFNMPASVTVGPSGDVYVADSA